jgi:hypothetical protein
VSDNTDEIDAEEEGPVIAIEFWDTDGNLVVAHFPPSGEADAMTADSTTSVELLEMRGRDVAQVSICVDNGAYQRVGDIVSSNAPIEDLVQEFLSMPLATYEQLRKLIPDAALETSDARVLN